MGEVNLTMSTGPSRCSDRPSAGRSRSRSVASRRRSPSGSDQRYQPSSPQYRPSSPQYSSCASQRRLSGLIKDEFEERAWLCLTNEYRVEITIGPREHASEDSLNVRLLTGDIFNPSITICLSSWCRCCLVHVVESMLRKLLKRLRDEKHIHAFYERLCHPEDKVYDIIVYYQQ